MADWSNDLLGPCLTTSHESLFTIALKPAGCPAVAIVVAPIDRLSIHLHSHNKPSSVTGKVRQCCRACLRYGRKLTRLRPFTLLDARIVVVYQGGGELYLGLAVSEVLNGRYDLSVSTKRDPNDGLTQIKGSTALDSLVRRLWKKV